MSKKEKLIRRLLSRPKDFTFGELVTLLGYFDYYVDNAGKTSGSRVTFLNDGDDVIRIHKPHLRNTLKPYQVDGIISDLEERSLI